MPTTKPLKTSGRARSPSAPKTSGKQTRGRSGGLQPPDEAKPRKTKKTKARDARPADTIRRSEGIWYLVRDVDKWKFFAHKIHPKSDIQDHSAFWEQIVAPSLARSYKLSEADARELALHPYGFPRGRVALVDGVLKFYHGNDWQRFITSEEIEKCFNPDGEALQWVFDEHETQLGWDCDQVRGIVC